MRLSDNDVMVAATLAAAVGETMTSKTAVDLVTVLDEIIDELTKRGGTGAMCAAAFKKHFPDQVNEQSLENLVEHGLKPGEFGVEEV